MPVGVKGFQKGNKIGIGNKHRLGSVPWNKGKNYSASHKGRHLSEEHKEALRVPHKGSGIYERTEWHKEITRQSVTRLYASGARLGFRGKKYFSVGSVNNNWKGGVTPTNEKIRKSNEYKVWRGHVFNRDNYTCQKCGNRGGELHADHELPFALYPDLRFEVLNGQTLCVSCHRKTDTYGRKSLETYKLAI